MNLAGLPNPIVADHADGCWIWDVDGNKMLDLRLGDWVLIHGHRDPDVDRAVRQQMERGWQIGAPEWDLSHRLAELLSERTQSLEKVRFFASGTDANLCALRLARAHTGKAKVAKVAGSYHGTADVLISGTSVLREQPVPPGVPMSVASDIVEIPFNDSNGAEVILERTASEVAAVLVEPILGVAGMIEAQPDDPRPRSRRAGSR
jgi:glutamate-1-semialdehyde 2,1-aminomutase